METRGRRTQTILDQLAGAVIVLLVLAAAPLQGQLVDCHGLDEVAGYKILLDDIAFFGEEEIPAPVLEVAMKRLRSRLTMELQELRLEAEQDLEVVRCQGRSPSGHTDFSDSVVQVLRLRDVLVELWGTVLASNTGSDAFVTYVLVPVRSHPELGSASFQEVEYSASSGARAAALAELFSGRSELSAFVAISLGMDQFRQDRYGQARASLCRGQLLLQETRPDDDPLIQMVAEAATSVVQSARSDPRYRGLLKAPQIGGCDG